MSFRELRNFCEIMRALGYPRLISVENFRTPNFELVADILFWMVHRYEPNTDISDDISREQHRVQFIKSVAQIFASKGRIKLNTRKLYGADGYAVKEMLKIATVLHQASRAQVQDEDEGSQFTLNAKLHDLKSTRSLASEITDSGVKLYDLLGKEKDLREAREKALRFLDSISRNLDSNAEHDYIERCIKDLIASVAETVETTEKTVANLEHDEKNLDAKIKKKTLDLERAEKRLKSLATVRPAFMDEYEKLEKDLEKYYEVYLERFRNLDFLEHELDVYHQLEQEKVEESDRALKRMQKRIRDAELRILRGEEEMGDNGGDEFSRTREGEDGDKLGGSRQGSARDMMQRPSAARGRGGSASNSGPRGRMENVVGSMGGRNGSDSDVTGSDNDMDSDDGQESGNQSPSGSDDLIDDDDEEDLSEDDGDEDAFGESGSDHEF
eukprot:GILK01002456.1.p1 GENE.GILK01002456.1~~GILK01002456.1.p1  ORF type:complete len:441 (+),score=102.48 GILK01002456.1:114-1436(+)